MKFILVAESQLRNEASARPDFLTNLLSLIATPQVALPIRQAAALFFKNFVRQNWKVSAYFRSTRLTIGWRTPNHYYPSKSRAHQDWSSRVSFSSSTNSTTPPGRYNWNHRRYRLLPKLAQSRSCITRISRISDLEHHRATKSCRSRHYQCHASHRPFRIQAMASKVP